MFLSLRDSFVAGKGVINTTLELPFSNYSVGSYASKFSLEMTLSEIDFDRYAEQQEMLKISCSLLVNVIRSNLDKDDTFVKLNFPGKFIL